MGVVAKRHLGAVMLVAGTCIGSGTIALPLFLAQVGLLPSLAVMIITWWLAYYTAFVNLELNLQAGKGLPLGDLARRFSGPVAQGVGTLSLGLLSYALLTAYLDLGASVVQELLGGLPFKAALGGKPLIVLLALGVGGMLMLPMRRIDYLNRCLFIGLVLMFGVLMWGLSSVADFLKTPLWGPHTSSLKAWCRILPVVFTSFGFQVIFHTMTEYCQKNSRTLKNVFFWGSLIPAVTYVVWTLGAMSVLASTQPAFYEKMQHGAVSAAEMIRALSQASDWPGLQGVIWCTTLLAILTSLLGVAIGLRDSLGMPIKRLIKNEKRQELAALLVAILPSAVLALWVPNAFVFFFSFAGTILALIAVLLPFYLLLRTPRRPFYYEEALSSPFSIVLSVGLALLIFASELLRVLF